MHSLTSYSGSLPHASPSRASSLKKESPQKVASPFKVVFKNQQFKVTDKVLGEGGDGVVTRGFSLYSESPVAVKTVSDRMSAQLEVSGLQCEIRHTVRYRGEFEYHDEYSIVMDEVLGKNIYEAYLCPKESKIKLTLGEVKSIAVQLFEILEDLEDKNLINYDIKPENLIWLRDSNSLSLVDLASIREVGADSDTDPHVTINYLAPEWILGGEVDCSYNVWSAGCTLFEIIVGEKLFPHHRQQIEEVDFVLLQIVQQIGKPSQTYLEQFGRAIECFDENLECKDKWDVLPQAPWADRLKTALLSKGASEEEVTEWTNLLSSMLQYENRVSPQELMTSSVCKDEIKVHLIFDHMNKCTMQLTRASKTDTDVDLFINLSREKNCCIHIPKDPNDQYILKLKKLRMETQATITLKAGENLDITTYQTEVEPAKKKLFAELAE